VNADEEQISQVLGNIVINAREAMPGGGAIEITAENIRVTRDMGLPVEGGQYVKICVVDHGTGISRENIDRVFDPYFTTKAEQHSGLGLAVAYFIIKKHSGHILVDSTLGSGTSVCMYLPITKEKVEPPVAERRLDSIREHGRILVMDDDEMVRSLTENLLRRFGYTVESSGEGDDAIAKYKAAKERGQPFEAVIIDLTIVGGLGGRETIAELRAFDPGIKAIVTTGYSHESVLAEYLSYGFRAVLPKPFRAAELHAAVRKVIEEGGS
jgi:CheY-like chemotaxis protein